MRHAAENVVLTFSPMKVENVKSARWYQLFDSDWHDRFCANEKDRGYRFVLVNRDLSVSGDRVIVYGLNAEKLGAASD